MTIRRFGLTRRLPFLKNFFRTLIFKLLDFSEYPFTKGLVLSLLKERDLKLYEIFYKDDFHEYHRSLLKILLPDKDFENLSLTRLGSFNDGGYMVPNTNLKHSKWISIGLGNNVDFENHLSNKLNNVFAFDHTLDSRPKKLNNDVIWFKFGYSRVPRVNTGNLKSLFELSGIESKEAWNLKADIEGYEWELFLELIESDSRPEIIVSELHFLLFDPDAFKSRLATLLKLNEYFEPVSIQGNNFSAYYSEGNYGIYDSMEVTFIRRDMRSKYLSILGSSEKKVYLNDPSRKYFPVFSLG
jgi:hypothetical protein